MTTQAQELQDLEMNDDDRTLTRADKQDILDHITRERRNGDNYVDKQLSKVNGKIDKLQEDMTQVERDVRVLKAYVEGYFSE